MKHIFAWLLVIAWAGLAGGHEMRPAYLELREGGEESYDVLWKVPARGDLRLSLDPRFDAETKQVSEPVDAFVGGAHVRRWRIQRPGGLGGSEVVIDGLSRTFTDVLVRVAWRDGGESTRRVTPERPTFVVDAAPNWWQVAWTYCFLGVEHILLGVDHLLFVLGLLLIVRGRGMLVKTITAFTIAHSITLAVATFRIIAVPAEPLNASIALSILFLGPEIVRRWRGQTSLTIRHPWVVAFLFGLLHGVGFASGLSVAGLPTNSIPFALLWFNLGVEAGQLAFVFVALGMVRAYKAVDMRWPVAVARAPGYAVGVLGAYWTIDRTLAMFG